MSGKASPMATQTTMVARRPERVRQSSMASDRPGHGRAEQTLGSDREHHQDEYQSDEDLVVRTDVGVEELLHDPERQAPAHGPGDAPEPTDGQGQEALQREVQADVGVREGDGGDDEPGDGR